MFLGISGYPSMNDDLHQDATAPKTKASEATWGCENCWGEVDIRTHMDDNL